MNKFFTKTVALLAIGLSTLANAQFNNKNRIEKLQEFDFQKFSWGFYLNGSVYDYKLVLHPRYGMENDKNLVSSKASIGFGAGLIGKMRINDHIDLRIEPGLQFVERELRFDTQSNDQYSAGSISNEPFTPLQLSESDKIRKVKSTYLDVPVLAEFHGRRWYNSRPYVAGGVNYILNLQSKSNSKDDNLQGVYRSATHNFAWTAEMGVQFYFNKFKFTPAIRGTFFLNNETVKDNSGTPPYWAKSLAKAQTRAIMLVLKFE
ncbi:MAG: PorT protein [Flavobacteriales bacterium]|nr:MAG: PorT protein [Flavobacteriales bacterium]